MEETKVPDGFLESCNRFKIDNSNYLMMAHVDVFFENFKVANKHDYAIISEISCPLERLTNQKEYIIALNI